MTKRNINRRGVLTGMGAMAGLAGTGSFLSVGPAHAADGFKIRMQLGWLASNGILGEVMADKLGYFAEEGLELLLAGDLLGEVELPADFAGSIEQRYLVAALGSDGGTGEASRTRADHRDPALGGGRCDALEVLDIDTLSPREALDKLYELKALGGSTKP